VPGRDHGLAHPFLPSVLAGSQPEGPLLDSDMPSHVKQLVA